MHAWLPALAVFFGSFLLFGIQPMLGRTLLPPFGGSAAVWTICLAAYQLLLLIGYGYAHLLAQRPVRTQRRLHLALLALSVLWTFGFAALRVTLKNRIGNLPVPSLEVLFCVLLFAGLPYVLLSANSTLIQAWLTRKGGAGGGADQAADRRGVYRLYAVSNLGSLLGLLAYPFVLEPLVSLNLQWYGFAACLLAYAALLAAVAKGASPSDCPSQPDAAPPPDPAEAHVSGLPAPLTRPWLWFALPCLSTFLLNAVTVHLSMDVTPVPMMWVLLLTAFLLSYILGFSAVGEKGLIVWAGASVVTLLAASFVLGLEGGKAFLPYLLTGVALVGICCTCLHGWLYRIRPDAAHLTRFYLGIAAGGAAGGAAASLLAPVLFARIWEYPLALLAVGAAAAWLIHLWNHPELKGLNRVLLGFGALAAFLTVNQSLKTEDATLLQSRNFYGCLRTGLHKVKKPDGSDLFTHQFFHGRTLHGVQAQDPSMRRQASTYFGPLGGGFPLQHHPSYARAETPMRVAVIGLGIGTLAAYGRTNDLYRFYEINPQVVAVAQNTRFFTYLSDSPATIEVSVGDARKNLEKERLAREPLYDVLVVDAYSGDSVPFHLATREAFQLYLDRLAPDGVLAIHVSNWHIDLLPLCKRMAEDLRLHATGILSSRTPLTLSATWVMLTRQPHTYRMPQGAREIDWARVGTLSTPTDEMGSLLSLIRFSHTPPLKELDVDLNRVRLFQ